MLNLLQTISSLIFRFHKVIVTASLILVILASILIFRIDIKTDIMDALPAENPVVNTFINFIDDFGSMSNLIIVLKSTDKKVEEYIGLAEYIGKRLEKSPFIEYADYNILNLNKGITAGNFPLFLNREALEKLKGRLTKEGIEKQIRQNKKQLLSPVGTPVDVELILQDPLNIRSIMLLSLAQGNSVRLSIRHGYYISEDNSMLLIFARPLHSSRDIMFVKRLRAEIDQIVEDAKKEFSGNNDLQIGLTGPYAYAIESQITVQKDVFINAAISTILVFFLFQFVYRKRFAVVIIAAATLLAALSWTLGIAYLIFGSLNLGSSIITAMLMGLGIDYIIHIFNRCESEFIKTGDIRQALYTSLTCAAPGVVTGALTTSTAFFSIIATNFKGLYQLGIVAGIGILACLISTLLFMASLIMLVENYKTGLLFRSKEQGFGMEGISRIVKDYPGLIIFTGISLLVLALVQLPNIRFDNNPEAIGPKKSKVMIMEKEVGESFGKQKNPLMISISAEDREGLMKRYDELETIIGKWREKGTIASHSSLRPFLPPPSRQREVLSALKGIKDSIGINEMEKVFINALKENGFAIDGRYATYIKTIRNAVGISKPIGLEAVENINDKKIGYFYNGEKLKVAAYLYPGNGIWDDAAITLLQEEIKGLGKDFSITGAPIMFAGLKDSIIRESIAAAAIACILIFFIIYMQFKTLRRAVLVLIPLFIGFTLALGFMGMTGMKFNYINIGAITLLFGIGVDYGVYIMQDYLESRQGSAEASVKHAGKTVIMCAMTTIAGFGSLMTMEYQGMATLGIVITAGVAACLLCALFFLPALIHYFEK